MTGQDDLLGRQLGDFRLVELIGEGGFGKVYRCRQLTLGREAVIKVLHDRLRRRTGQLPRFLREAQVTALLDHPYAEHVYGVDGEPDGLVWIAMEFVPGNTLKTRLRDRGPMPLDQFV